jgi:hypothetical protein
MQIRCGRPMTQSDDSHVQLTQAQAGLRFDSADALVVDIDVVRRRHDFPGEFLRHGEAQFVVVATTKLQLTLLGWIKRCGQRGGRRQCGDVDFRPHSACRQHMVQVGQQSIRDIDTGCGQSTQSQAQFDPGRWPFEKCA